MGPVRRVGAPARAALSSVALAALAGAGCAPAIGARPLAVARPGETTFHTLQVGARRRSFLLHLPPGVRHPVPLLLAFHGYMANANIMEETTGLDAAADRRGWAVAYANGTGGLRYVALGFNAVSCCGTAPDRGVDDVGFARALVDTLVRAGLADRARVYATGFSNGGMLALRLACQDEPFVRGVADVAGAMPDTVCQGRRGVPVMLVRGARDDELRADQRDHRRRNANAFAVSFAGALRYWMRRNGCEATPARDSTPALVEVRALGCPPGRDVRELIVAGQAHAWPGGSKPWFLAPPPSRGVDASALIVSFLEQQTREQDAR